ncbi:hypothetical protein KIN20_013659 [Parelaphostrongylus tenuis]|uniref:Uncharacterized protein n=1 Tax=Parelaphostrongylus tenuis TaxID=148309 RepID=A0AAD5MCF8_PARTN|nr:hypothetical protein KIN20_013659 [Parelaphostrongylus tenuis]
MVTDVLEEQGRRAGLFPTVISGISTQLTIRFSYNALQCDNVLVNPNDAQNMQIVVTMGVQGTCIFIGNTVSTICTAMPATRCMHHGNYTDIVLCRNTSDYIWSSLDHQYHNGELVDSNVAESDDREFRSPATGPFGTHFSGVSVTIGS